MKASRGYVAIGLAQGLDALAVIEQKARQARFANPARLAVRFNQQEKVIDGLDVLHDGGILGDIAPGVKGKFPLTAPPRISLICPHE